jgi:HD superfamily phosphodiesterase
MAGMLHDIYSYAKMDTVDHARKGATLARGILARLQITNDDETGIICTAIHAHSDKELTHSPFDEVLKDADVFQSCLYNPTFEIQPNRKDRYEKLRLESGLE